MVWSAGTEELAVIIERKKPVKYNLFSSGVVDAG